MWNTGKSWTGYTWLRDGLIPAQSALLEALWAFAWINFALASNPDSASVRFNFGWILALLLLPALFGRWLERAGAVAARHRQGDASSSLGWDRRTGRLILLALAAVLFLAFVKTQAVPGRAFTDWRWLTDVIAPWTSVAAANREGLVLFAWLAAAVLIVRGVWLALGDITADSAAGWFLAGLGAFLLLFAVLAKSPQPASYGPDRAWLGPLLAIYLFGGVGWLALVRQQYLEEETFRGASDRLNLSWLAVFSVLSALMLGIAAIVAVLGGRALLAVEQAALFVGGLLWQAATTVFLWLVGAVLWLLRLLPPIHALAGPPLRATPRGLKPGALPPPAVRLPALHLPFEVPIGLLFVGLLALMAVFMALSHRGRDFTPAGDEERSSLWSWSLLWRQLRQALAGVRPRRSAAPLPTAAASAAQPDGGLSIRTLYRAVLRWSREQGRPRQPGQTPAEFEPALADHLPPGLAADLTGAYARGRYGGQAPATGELARLLDGWQQASQPREASEREGRGEAPDR